MEIAGTVQRRPLILVSLLLAAFVINLDITIVNVALPTLVRELHASNSQLQWVVDAYNLCSRRCYWPPAASATASAARDSCSPAWSCSERPASPEASPTPPAS